MKLGIVSLGGKSSTDIAKEALKYFDKVDSLELKKFEVEIDEKGTKVTYENKKLDNYDCLYVRGSHKYSVLQRAITRPLKDDTYMPTESKAFTIAHDKFLTMIEFQKHHVSMPRTFYVP